MHEHAHAPFLLASQMMLLCCRRTHLTGLRFTFGTEYPKVFASVSTFSGFQAAVSTKSYCMSGFSRV